MKHKPVSRQQSEPGALSGLPRPRRYWLAFAGFALIAGFFLWQEHRAHLLGALPWLILLACPLMHIFMHRGHGHSGHDTHKPREK